MNNYYLIGRNIKTNELKIIELKTKDFDKNNTKNSVRSNSLEVIDLITTRFKSSNDMAKRLYSKGYIDSADYDFFIANKYKRNGVSKIAYQEVIYNYDTQRTELLREVAYNSLKKNTKCSENIIILDEFLNTLFLSAGYSNVVCNGLTNLNQKLVDTISFVHIQDKVPYNLKYRNYWMLDNYKITRNVVDSLNRFFEYNKDYNGYRNYADYYRENKNIRNDIEKQLLIICDKDYIEGQTSLFDVANTEEIEADNIESDNKVLTKEEKKKHVMYYLTHLGLSAFSHDSRNRISIDLNDFLDSFDVKNYRILKNNLSPLTIKNAYLYNLHNTRIKLCSESFSEVSQLEEDLRADYKDLSNSLSTDKAIDNAYEFCITYENVCKKELDKNKVKSKKTDEN